MSHDQLMDPFLYIYISFININHVSNVILVQYMFNIKFIFQYRFSTVSRSTPGQIRNIIGNKCLLLRTAPRKESNGVETRTDTAQTMNYSGNCRQSRIFNTVTFKQTLKTFADCQDSFRLSNQ